MSTVREEEPGSASYPVMDFNNFQSGPVLSHVRAVDELRTEHDFVRSTSGQPVSGSSPGRTWCVMPCSTRRSSPAP